MAASDYSVRVVPPRKQPQSIGGAFDSERPWRLRRLRCQGKCRADRRTAASPVIAGLTGAGKLKIAAAIYDLERAATTPPRHHFSFITQTPFQSRAGGFAAMIWHRST